MGFTVIDLSQLPPPNVVEELDYEQTLSEILQELNSRYPDFSAPLESDPAYKILEVCAYREMLLRAKINDEAKAVMLPYADDEDLENLGAFWNVKKQVIDPGNPDAIPPREPVYESNDSFRYRIQLAMEGQTNAGTEGAYLYQTLSADELVKSAAAKSPSAGDVVVTVLSRESDGTASPELLQDVTDHLMQPHIRQMDDHLTIQSAGIITYRVKATLYINNGPGSDQVMEAARQTLTDYVQAMHRIGVLVPISGIYGALQQPGVERVELDEPLTDINPSDVQAAYCSAIELTQAAAS